MAWLTGRVQYKEDLRAKEIFVGDCPYYKKNGRYYKKETGEEVDLKVSKIDLKKYLKEKEGEGDNW